MKKLITLVLVAAFTVAAGSLLAQEIYTGGAMPAGYSNPVQNEKVPVTNIDNGTVSINSAMPADYKTPDYGAYSANRNLVVCDNPCSTPEGEADIPDEGTDVTNGGCNYEPYRTLPIAFGDVICGRGNGYTVGGAPFRDTDWYEFTLTGNQTVYFSGFANFNCAFYIVSLPCPGAVIASATPLIGTVGTAVATIGPGTYICFAAPSSFGSDPLLDGDYMITLTDVAPGDPLTWCYQFSCLQCASPEGEPPNQNEIGDWTNYGCNGVEFDPDRPPVFSPINIGDIICGTGDHYSIGNVDYRDTDWYRLVLTSEKQLFWSGVADFSITMIIIQGPCNAQVTKGSVSLTPHIPGTISAVLGPGEYYFWIGPSNWLTDNNGDYMVTLTEYDPGSPHTWCTPQLVPVSNWALFIGIGLILIFAIVRFRRFS